MQLAISNIAWDIKDDESVVNLLNRFNVSAIDIAPGKYFPSPTCAIKQEVDLVKGWWLERGIAISGMQALLFGTNGLNVFGTRDSQNAMFDHLSAVCQIGKWLGASRLVFGSPKNRDRSGLTDEQAMEVAIPFFRHLGDIAQDHGVMICLEPNPICYGANFMTDSYQTALVVREVNHSAIKMQLDTGALTINGEDPDSILKEHASLIGHIHASEPDLLPLGDGGADHMNLGAAIHRHLPTSLVSIEMLATTKESPLTSVERALSVGNRYYANSF